jgi:hypothetical protein
MFVHRSSSREAPRPPAASFGSGASFLRMSDGMFREELFAELCSKNSSQMPGAATGLPGKVPILNCSFRIFSASSMPLIVIVAKIRRRDDAFSL